MWGQVPVKTGPSERERDDLRQGKNEKEQDEEENERPRKKAITLLLEGRFVA